MFAFKLSQCTRFTRTKHPDLFQSGNNRYCSEISEPSRYNDETTAYKENTTAYNDGSTAYKEIECFTYYTQ